MTKSSKIKKIEAQSLVARVTSMIRKGIIEGRFDPGEHLQEIRLSNQLGVSRGPIREAFRMLENEGLVETIPRKGVRVRELSINDIESIYELRSTLESLAVKLALPNLKEEDVIFLENILHHMQSSIEQKDINSYKKLNSEFHDLFYQRSHNKWLYQTYQDLTNSIMRLRSLSFSNMERLQKSYQEHVLIVKAIKEKQIKGLEKFAYQHINKAGQFVLQFSEKTDKTHTDSEERETNYISLDTFSRIIGKSKGANSHESKMIITDAFQGYRLEGILVRVLIQEGVQGGLKLMNVKTMCFKKSDVHAIIMINENQAQSKAKVTQFSELGFIEFSSSGVLTQGDTVTIGKRDVGTIAGFDETPLPNYINVILKVTTMGPDSLEVKPGNKILFTDTKRKD